MVLDELEVDQMGIRPNGIGLNSFRLDGDWTKCGLDQMVIGPNGYWTKWQLDQMAIGRDGYWTK